jgi:hypothetical protein
MSTVDTTQVAIVLHQAQVAAQEASVQAYATIGERDACGFAWVKVRGVRINSRVGKELVKAGFGKDWNGGLMLWNPGKHNTQSVSVKEAGAVVYADYLRNQLGLEAHAGSRLD